MSDERTKNGRSTSTSSESAMASMKISRNSRALSWSSFARSFSAEIALSTARNSSSERQTAERMSLSNIPKRDFPRRTLSGLFSIMWMRSAKIWRRLRDM